MNLTRADIEAMREARSAPLLRDPITKMSVADALIIGKSVLVSLCDLALAGMDTADVAASPPAEAEAPTVQLQPETQHASIPSTHLPHVWRFSDGARSNVCLRCGAEYGTREACP